MTYDREYWQEMREAHAKEQWRIASYALLFMAAGGIVVLTVLGLAAYGLWELLT